MTSESEQQRMQQITKALSKVEPTEWSESNCGQQIKHNNFSIEASGTVYWKGSMICPRNDHAAHIYRKTRAHYTVIRVRRMGTFSIAILNEAAAELGV